MCDALAHLAIAALELGDTDAALAHTRDACALAETNGLEGLRAVFFVWTVAALVEAEHGEARRARVYAEQGRVDLEAIGDFHGFVPQLQLLAPTCLAEAYLELGEFELARHMYRRADAARASEPYAVVALRRLDRVRDELARVALDLPAGLTLTTSEHRVLELLTTHASMEEIGRSLFVSRNTVKTHALSIYRKLGVSSRSEAIERARDLHVLRD